MDSSIYTNTGIVETSWNSRGLITHNFINKTLISQDNGILWAAVRENNINQYVNIYRSIDNGFTWNKMWSGTFSMTTRRTGISGLNINGPVMHMTVNEKLNILHLFHSYFNTATEKYHVQLFSFEISDTALTKVNPDTSPGNEWAVDGFITDMDSLAFDISYNDDSIFMTYASYSTIYVQSFSHTSLTSSDGGTRGTNQDNYFDMLSTHADNNSKLHVIALADNTSSFSLVYFSYDKFSGNMSTPVNITSFPAADVSDINICKDNNGALLAYWSQKTEDDVFINQYYSYSLNNGVSWIEPEIIPNTLGQSDFIDANLNQKAGRTVAIECNEGFILSYTRSIDAKSISYIRTLEKIDSTFSLSDESIAASHNTKPITGIRFFRPIGAGKYDINTKEEIRFAYQVGQGDSTIQRDKVPVYFGQKLLKNEAFPETTTIEYNADVATENQLLVNFNLLGSTYENVDYYNEGLVGELTKKYVSAFERFGTSINIDQYEPIQESVLADKSSYSFESTSYVKVYFQDVNYGFPSPSSNESFDSYIERDMRKIHLPPYFHLSRNFIINDGNKLRRTVWIANFGGNQYELSQVVPKFADNQIVYYTANAYVVGPSRNPFTRTILPSET